MRLNIQNSIYQKIYDIIHLLRYKKSLLLRPVRVARIRRNCSDLKIYYGCGDISQPGYINVDIRYTRSVDIIGDLAWCSRTFHEACSEVYLSHVLEHYGYPGREKRHNCDSVLNALANVYAMLRPGGIIRVAVPDFAQLCALYQKRIFSLYPRISGRICGEQDYQENLHRCVFDREFLELCLLDTNFIRINEWKALESDLVKDSSFDSLEGFPTSLNLVAEKPVS